MLLLFFYLGREIVRFEVGGFVVNEGVVHRTPVAGHESRLQTHHSEAGADVSRSRPLSNHGTR